MQDMIRGKVYVLGDNIDTDQIIPAHYLMYNPAIPAERKQFGRYALCGVPDAQAGLPKGKIPFVDQSDESNTRSDFSIIIGGSNFGCGSSREHAPLALAEAGVQAVVAGSYARIFYRNSVNGGYLVPFEFNGIDSHDIATGDEVEIHTQKSELVHIPSGKKYPLNPLGDVAPIIEAGGVFNYAKSVGML